MTLRPYGQIDMIQLHWESIFCRILTTVFAVVSFRTVWNCLKYIYIYTYILYIWWGSITRNYGVFYYRITKLNVWAPRDRIYIYIYKGTDFFARHHRWLAMADGWWLTIDGCDLYINTYHRYLAMADGWWVNFYGFEIQPRYICLMGPCFDRYVNAQSLY